MKTERFREFEKDAAVLKKIAEQYPINSKEYEVIERAAFALSFVLTVSPEQFSEFARESDSDLTDEQRAYLAKLGLG